MPRMCASTLQSSFQVPLDAREAIRDRWWNEGRGTKTPGGVTGGRDLLTLIMSRKLGWEAALREAAAFLGAAEEEVAATIVASC